MTSDERALLLEAHAKHPEPILVERRDDGPQERHVAATALEQQGLLRWSHFAGGIGASRVFTRVEYQLTPTGQEVARAEVN